MKKKYKILATFLLFGCNMMVQILAQNHRIAFQTNSTTGAIDKINIEGDSSKMNWLVATDGSQYPWIVEKYGWGLGYFTESHNKENVKREWKTPSEIKRNGTEITYLAGNIQIHIVRRLRKGDLVEEYTFTNIGHQDASLSDIGIYTPFNDNYPDAKTCMTSRTNVHIWAGENAAYVNAVRMGGYSPHLGLVVTKGSIKSYEISERGPDKGMSDQRSIISLNLPDLRIKPGEKHALSWYVFSHSGNNDFHTKVLKKGGIIASANKYVFAKGETARIEFFSNKSLTNGTLTKNGTKVAIQKEGNAWVGETKMDELGEVRFDFLYDNGKRTHATCLVIDNIDNHIQKRVDFIRIRQQMNNPSDPRDGAYMVYDNEENKIYLNDTPNCNPVDRDEGAERVGMGVLLAKQYLLKPNPELKTSLVRYATFIREKLQREDYVTYSSTDQKGRNRGYNYMWVAEFYFQMYKVTGEKHYITDGYQTLKSMFRQFGYGFYAIGIPVRLGLQTVKDAGMNEEYEDLRNDFIQTGDIFISNGLNYPKHEVNYEQSIVAPAIMVLTQLYLETGNRKYLDEAKRQLPVLEAFGGFQPSYHLNEIAIRHWDGYWFGKREMWGDVFPHYWSTLTAAAYHYYSLCTDDLSYQKRAENIVRNNLCLFFEDGKASCAYMYPYKVDGVKAEFYDPYANDQDWALVYYLLVNENTPEKVVHNGIPWLR